MQCNTYSLSKYNNLYESLVTVNSTLYPDKLNNVVFEVNISDKINVK